MVQNLYFHQVFYWPQSLNGLIMGAAAYLCSTVLEVFGLYSLSAAKMLSLNHIHHGPITRTLFYLFFNG